MSGLSIEDRIAVDGPLTHLWDAVTVGEFDERLPGIYAAIEQIVARAITAERNRLADEIESRTRDLDNLPALVRDHDAAHNRGLYQAARIVRATT